MRGARAIAAESLTPHGGHRVSRSLPEEVAVAFTVNGATHAVMMATPRDLEDFAIGFAASEGIATRDQIERLEILEHPKGIEARLWVPDAVASDLSARRRASLGPLGCGLCGIDSLEEALRPLPRLPEPTGPRLTLAEAAGAPERLRAHQPLHDLTHGAHGAGLFLPGHGIVLAREDVGRHNALDKLIGAAARAGQSLAEGAIVLTSRVSVDMVQKTVLAGCPVLIAVSAPTAQALALAQDAGLTVVCFARGGRLEIFTHPTRIDRRAPDAA